MTASNSPLAVKHSREYSRTVSNIIKRGSSSSCLPCCKRQLSRSVSIPSRIDPALPLHNQAQYKLPPPLPMCNHQQRQRGAGRDAARMVVRVHNSTEVYCAASVAAWTTFAFPSSTHSGFARDVVAAPVVTIASCGLPPVPVPAAAHRGVRRYLRQPVHSQMSVGKSGVTPACAVQRNPLPHTA